MDIQATFHQTQESQILNSWNFGKAPYKAWTSGPPLGDIGLARLMLLLKTSQVANLPTVLFSQFSPFRPALHKGHVTHVILVGGKLGILPTTVFEHFGSQQCIGTSTGWFPGVGLVRLGGYSKDLPSLETLDFSLKLKGLFPPWNCKPN